MEIISKNFDLIQSMVKNCELCQQTDFGDDSWSSGLRIDLHQLFSEYEIEASERSVIIEHLKCPNCGNFEFNEFSYVGVDFSEIDVYETAAYRSSIIYGRQIEEFAEFLKSYPSLPLQHEIGKSLFEKINKKTFKEGTINGTFFRCRKQKGAIALGNEEMKAPPLGVSGQGRYNYEGQNHFYISSKKSVAIAEVLQGTKEDVIVWIQKFKVEKPIDNLVDLRELQIFNKNNLGLLNKALFYSGFLVNKEGAIENWKPGYFFTRFVMDCVKHANYDGIIYNSLTSLNDYNVVLFRGDDSRIVPKGNPKFFRPNKPSPQSDVSLPF